MIFKRIKLCYRSEQWRNHADEILLHFSNRTLYFYFWTKMAKSGYCVRNAVPVYQWKKNKWKKIYFPSYPIPKSFTAVIQEHWLVLGWYSFAGVEKTLLNYFFSWQNYHVNSLSFPSSSTLQPKSLCFSARLVIFLIQEYKIQGTRVQEYIKYILQQHLPVLPWWLKSYYKHNKRI